MMIRLPKPKSLLSSVFALVLSFTMTACLNSESDQAGLKNKDFIEAQAQQYALDMERYAVQAAHLVTNHASWQTQTFTQGEVIDFAALGGTPDAGSNVNSGLCIKDSDPDTAMLITWFTNQDDDGTVFFNGIGSGISGGLMARMSSHMASDSLAIHENGQLTMLGSSNAQPLDTNCRDFDIPQQSPVLISELAIPDLPDNTITKEDIRVTACAEGQTGHVIEKSTITMLPNGTSSRSAWQESVNSCKDDIQISAMTSAENKVEGFVVGALATQGSSEVVAALNNGLGNIRCNYATTDTIEASTIEDNVVFNRDVYQMDLTNAERIDPHSTRNGAFTDSEHWQIFLRMWYRNQTGQQNNTDNDGFGRQDDVRNNSVGSMMAAYLRYAAINNLPRVVNDYAYERINEYDENTEFDTCGTPEEAIALDAISEVRTRLARVEVSRSPCGGDAGQFSDNINGHWGIAQHTAWDGEAIYNRDVYAHEMDDDLLVQSAENRTQRENWYGESIECSREETFNIECDTVYPGVGGQPGFRATDTTGFNYRRTNTISGWADSENLRPNPQANPLWNETRSSCEWRETDRWRCSAGRLVQNGERNRTHSSNSLGQSLQVSGWNLVQPALCQETRTQSGSCPAGQEGSVTINQRRIYTSNEPGAGSWGGWTETSRNSNCTTPRSDSGGGGDHDHGYDTDGDGVADTRDHSSGGDRVHDGCSSGRC